MHAPATWKVKPLVGSITGPVFASIPTKQIKAGQDPDQKKYNKYFDILPNPATIVELTSKAGMPRLEFDPGAFPYINANYIPGFDGKRTYIASQGPKEVGLPQFWRMIWQEGVKAVVMLTRFEERGKVKCSPYWGPTPGDVQSYAGFTVTTQKKTRSPYNYTVTELTVTADGESRDVRHYWFDAWPDLGVPPGDAEDLLRLNEDVFGFRGDETYPLVVHCAAGIGRTGVFIGLDIAINSLHCTGDFALVSTIKMMRNNRGCMVQTAEQAGYLLALIDKYRRDCVSGKAKPRPVISRGMAVESSGSDGARRVPVGRRASIAEPPARNGDWPPKPEHGQPPNEDGARSRIASAGRRGPPGMGSDDVAEPLSRNTSTGSAGRRGPPRMGSDDVSEPRSRNASTGSAGRRGPPGMGGDDGPASLTPRPLSFLRDYDNSAPASAPPVAKPDYVAVYESRASAMVADDEDGTSSEAVEQDDEGNVAEKAALRRRALKKKMREEEEERNRQGDGDDDAARLGLTEDDLDVYDELWTEACQGRARLFGDAGLDFFKTSGLEVTVLQGIWSMADSAKPYGALNKAEFFTGCKLVALVQAGLVATIANVKSPAKPPAMGEHTASEV